MLGIECQQKECAQLVLLISTDIEYKIQPKLQKDFENFSHAEIEPVAREL